MSESRKNKFKEETDKDEILRALEDLFLKGWPSRAKDLKPKVRLYWIIKDHCA